MPKGRSYKDDSWLAFERGPQTFTHDDFAHDKTFAFKARLENENDGVTVKETLNERPDGISSSGEAKYWFNLKEGSSFFGKIGTDSNLEIQYDNGIREIKGIKNNLYLGGIFNRTFTERQAFAGVQLFDENKWSFNGRVTYDYLSKSFKLDNKFKYLRNGWKVNGFATFDTHNKMFGKCGLLLGWTPKKQSECKWNYWLTAQHNYKSDYFFPHGLFNNVTLNLNNPVSETQTVGIETKIALNHLYGNILKHEHRKVVESLWLCSEWKYGDTVVKAKISDHLSHAICVRNKLGNYGTYSLGVEASDFPNKIKFKFGVRLDLTL